MKKIEKFKSIGLILEKLEKDGIINPDTNKPYTRETIYSILNGKFHNQQIESILEKYDILVRSMKEIFMKM